MGISEEYRGVVAITLASLLVLGGSFAVFATTAGTTNTGKLEVVASFYPLYYFTDQIGKDRIDLLKLLPDTAEPHSWEPKASDIFKVHNADVFIYNGGGFEPWLTSFLPNLKSNATIVDTSMGVNQTGMADPHFWMDPVDAKVQVRNIALALESRDPANASFYQANADDLNSRLDQLNQDYIVGLQVGVQNSTRKSDFITTHEGFNYLASRYGLVDHGAVGISGDAQPSARDVANLVKDVQSMNLHYVFAEPIYNDAVIQTIASETHCTVLILDALHGRSGAHAQMDYFQIMYANLDALRIGLEVPP
jgi:zinc transport system substrate-binding protein